MLTVAEALARILPKVPRMAREEEAIESAAGRVLGRELRAERTLPPWDNSAMDGFAVRACDTPGSLPVSGSIAAGDPPDAELRAGTVMRIMTGAPVPRGADSVIAREESQDHGATVTLRAAATPGQNIRRRGEDMAAGDELLAAGVALGPGEIAVAAAQGIARVPVARKPRVAIVATGDELVAVDQVPGPGQIVNSNAYALAAQVREAGAEPVPLGIARDDPTELVTLLTRALKEDVLVTSGGVSVGDFDYVRDAFASVGVAIDFWKVAMKPGKPLAFGIAPGQKPVFGLPGNPVSSMVVFELFARPALLSMLGARCVDRPRVAVVMTSAYRKEPGRAHYLRAKLARRGDTLHAQVHPRQESHILSSMIGADALVEVAAELAEVAAGARMPALLLRAV